MKNITLNSWTNPRTDEERIYVNGEGVLGYGEKAFFVQKGDILGEPAADLVIYGEGMGRAHKETIEGIIIDAIQSTGADPLKWDEVKALAE